MAPHPTPSNPTSPNPLTPQIDGISLGAVTFLVPELCAFHPLSVQAYQGARHVSSILWRLHSLLNAHDFRSHLEQLCERLPG